MTRAAFTTRQVLDALTAVLTEQLERDQNFRFTRRHVFPTAWAEIGQAVSVCGLLNVSVSPSALL